ncbi:TniQ family protein [Pseudomonas sp. ML96]|uniref:TniQ family protein n=1 Tax=Pseudomonas sp. ML96 TaxID=1523503 RepID=UPI0009DFC74F
MSTPFSHCEIPPIAAHVRWLPDETFFSLCSRETVFQCGQSELFGSVLQGAQPDFPCNLNMFDALTHSCWGDIDSIIEDHTIFPSFRPFITADSARMLALAMKEWRLGNIRARLGLTTSRFGTDLSLKACPDCIQSDASLHGVAYWHLKHQYPGVLICPDHQALLLQYNLGQRWAGSRFTWILPGEKAFSPLSADTTSAACQELLLSLATNAMDLAKIGLTKAFDSPRVMWTYERALADRFPADSGYSERHAAESFLVFAKHLRPFRPLHHLPSSEATSLAFIRSLRRPQHQQWHPLKHVLLITWLVGSLGAFSAAYDLCSLPPGSS